MATIADIRGTSAPETPVRNAGMPLDLARVAAVAVNTSAAERRAATLPTRRTVKQAWQAAWLLRAITCIDLTTLAGDDTPATVRRLAAKARQPVRADILEQLGVPPSLRLHTGAVCVYPNLVAPAVAALRGSGIPVASVATGFPAGQIPLAQKLDEIRAAREAGAREIDIVISRAHVLSGDWRALYEEVRLFREACDAGAQDGDGDGDGDGQQGAQLKTILATGELATLRTVARASWVCMMAGADVIKTSTGKEAVNATLPVGLVMVRAIRAYHEATGYRVGFKPAGGIRTAKQALDWLILLKEELGEAWLRAELFRIGASGLLTDIERQLEYYVTGRYAAASHQPMP